ncbi:MAG: hypothetical protein R3C52_04700 [Hyphomonadaceae bacterium]
MTRQDRLGVWVAAIAGVALIAAIVAGFAMVGGPGDARARRFDDQTMRRINVLAGGAACMWRLDGEIPKDKEAITSWFDNFRQTHPDETCSGYYRYDYNDDFSAIDYSTSEAGAIRLCAEFRRPSRGDMETMALGDDPDFPVLREKRLEAGRHCFDLSLTDIPREVSALKGAGPKRVGELVVYDADMMRVTD